MVIAAKIYLLAAIVILAAYALRHLIFSGNRLLRHSRPGLQDIFDSDPPSVTVLIPMHNEEKVADHILEALLFSDYPEEKLEIVPIDDHSSDHTLDIIRYYAERDSRVRPLRRSNGRPGKPMALDEAIATASGEILVVFDADYIPGRGLLRELVNPFVDPAVGAVMGRVVPLNCGVNLLTRLLDLERAAGYQVDQQARQNLRLIPQYGGTAGAFRKKAYQALGGFDPNVLAEDTELTFRLRLNGWTIVYANRCECYEEVPQTWRARTRQIRRWAIGHTQCFARFALKMLAAPGLRWSERVDGVMLLGIYLIGPLLALAFAASLFLFFIGSLNFLNTFLLTFAVIAFNSIGNFASFFQIGTAVLLDGSAERVRLLPLNVLNFALSIAVVTEALISHSVGRVLGRRTTWQKTERFRS
ncbi:MAG TPA: glycosyltransferase family 2 protein [Thermoanaerobaculia bacterium]|nr:glycosyltransferase family 2 protein [Thermoanaerobaculia bacterium]